MTRLFTGHRHNSDKKEARIRTIPKTSHGVGGTALYIPSGNEASPLHTFFFPDPLFVFPGLRRVHPCTLLHIDRFRIRLHFNLGSPFLPILPSQPPREAKLQPISVHSSWFQDGGRTWRIPCAS